MSLKDKLTNLKMDQVKDTMQAGLDKAKELESKAEQSEAGGKAKEGFGKLGAAARSRFKK